LSYSKEYIYILMEFERRDRKEYLDLRERKEQVDGEK
jgi:hypothetical protein